MEFKPNIKTEEKPTVENNIITKEKIDQAKEILNTTINELNDSMSHVEKSSPGRIKKIVNYLKENSGEILRPIGTAVFGATSILFALGQMQGSLDSVDLNTFIIAAASGVITSAGIELEFRHLDKISDDREKKEKLENLNKVSDDNKEEKLNNITQ